MEDEKCYLNQAQIFGEVFDGKYKNFKEKKELYFVDSNQYRAFVEKYSLP